MTYLAVYIFVGIGICLVVALRRKPEQTRELPLSILFDSVWPLVLLWPAWVAVVLIERSFPKASLPVSPVVADPIGQIGRVLVALRPVGRVQVGPAYFDARSAHGVLPEGATVRVVSKSMSELVVEEAPNQPPQPMPLTRHG